MELLSPDAREFLVSLHNTFSKSHLELLAHRKNRAKTLFQNPSLDFLPETVSIREQTWSVAKCPEDLLDRRVEITGPAEPKMMINALNSGAKVFMADLEDSLSPSWENILGGHESLSKAVRRELTFEANSKKYTLNEKIATLLVRPRGLHLFERNFTHSGQSISGSLFDFGLYFFHNAQETLQRGTGPYFYLPKMESDLEARWWNDVFLLSQKYLGIPTGSIRATVLIETILAAFEMDEILYELRTHASGLNAGRWDYIFSFIKKLGFDSKYILPDRAQVTMATPFMSAYAELLVQTCHKRGAHAIGGMSAFVPSRKDAEVNRLAFEKVGQDKDREARLGFDGSWVAHPDLVPVAQKEFDKYLLEKSNQKEKIPKRKFSASDLLDTRISGSTITEGGVRNNIAVAIQYIEKWLEGVGAVALYNLMEDAATAEISRSQLWQWVHHGVHLDDGRKFSKDLYLLISEQEFQKLGGNSNKKRAAAFELLQSLVLQTEFKEFLTLPAYDMI